MIRNGYCVQEGLLVLLVAKMNCRVEHVVIVDLLFRFYTFVSILKVDLSVGN
jgi:hypothetical protein